MSDDDVESLPGAVGALMSGVRGAIEFGASLMVADERDIHLSPSAFGRLDSLVAAVPDSLGRIRLRVVDDEPWGIISGGELTPSFGDHCLPVGGQMVFLLEVERARRVRDVDSLERSGPCSNEWRRRRSSEGVRLAIDTSDTKQLVGRHATRIGPTR